MGTFSGAAECLGRASATVIPPRRCAGKPACRQAVPASCGGYKTTEAGEELLACGRGHDDQFSRLACRIKGARGAVGWASWLSRR